MTKRLEKMDLLIQLLENPLSFRLNSILNCLLLLFNPQKILLSLSLTFRPVLTTTRLVLASLVRAFLSLAFSSTTSRYWSKKDRHLNNIINATLTLFTLMLTIGNVALPPSMVMIKLAEGKAATALKQQEQHVTFNKEVSPINSADARHSSSSIKKLIGDAAVGDRRLNDGGDVGPAEGPFDDYTQGYLTQFGYLPRGNQEMSNLRTDEAVKLALARLQQFAGLQPTGLLDHETRKLMLSKRCGLPDAPYDGSGGDEQFNSGHNANNNPKWRHRTKRYTLHGSKWHHFNITYKVNNSARTLNLPRTRRVLYDAFQVWSKASRLKFQETLDDKADIILKFASRYHGDNYPFDGPNVVLAHAFFPASGMGGDVHFDDDEAWNDQMKNENTVNLLSTAAHEIGHSLGLGHSKVQNSLMYPYYKYDMKEIKLEYDDIIAIQTLYGVGYEGAPEVPVEVTTRKPSEEEDDESYSTTTITYNYDVTQSTPSSRATPSIPHPCDTHIDAISPIRNEIFVFKNKYYWRLDQDGRVIEHPNEIARFFYGLPENLTHVDAVYQRLDKDRIVIFVGRLMYEFSGNRLLREPTDIKSLGFSEDVGKIDAAFVWKYNEKTYLFSGERYWRFDEERRRVLLELKYPRHIKAQWKKLPTHVDAAFTNKDGWTYFFKGDLVYKFSDYFMRVEKNFPKHWNKWWPHCKDYNNNNQNQNNINNDPHHHEQQRLELRSLSSAVESKASRLFGYASGSKSITTFLDNHHLFCKLVLLTVLFLLLTFNNNYEDY